MKCESCGYTHIPKVLMVGTICANCDRIRKLETRLDRYEGCVNTYHNEGCADNHRRTL